MPEELDTPWAKQMKPKHQRQEEKLDKIGGSKGIASGRFWRWKRDGRLHGFLIEARTTDNKSYSIKVDEWKDIEKQAHQTPPGLLPAMQIDIQGTSLIVLNLHDYIELQNRVLGEDA